MGPGCKRKTPYERHTGISDREGDEEMEAERKEYVMQGHKPRKVGSLRKLGKARS